MPPTRRAAFPGYWEHVCTRGVVRATRDGVNCRYCREKAPELDWLVIAIVAGFMLCIVGVTCAHDLYTRYQHAVWPFNKAHIEPTCDDPNTCTRDYIQHVVPVKRVGTEKRE